MTDYTATDALEEGRDAWVNAGSDACNPYDSRTMRGERWARGYEEACRVELGPDADEVLARLVQNMKG